MSGREAFIEGIEYQLPDGEVTNAEFAKAHPEWRMSDVYRRTGVRSRRWSGPEETALDLGAGAAERLLERTGIDRSSISAILFCTQTPDYVMPPNACLLQHRLGLPTAVAALDYSLACSGFVYGLFLGKSLVESGAAERVLLVTAETYSKSINRDDRGPATLFGDGGAATLIGRGRAGIGAVRLGTDGSNPNVFCIPAGGARTPRTPQTGLVESDRFGNRRSAEQISMDGAGVLAFVQRDLVDFIQRTLAEFGETWATVDLVVFHQASQATLDILVAKLRIPADKVFNNLECVGNTVSASIPIALRDAEQQGRLRPGMRVLTVGFGVGLSWGVCLIVW